jgi:hypothetical protein
MVFGTAFLQDDVFRGATFVRFEPPAFFHAPQRCVAALWEMPIATDGYAITGFANFEQPVANFDATRRQLAIRAFVLRVDSVH